MPHKDMGKSLTGSAFAMPVLTCMVFLGAVLLFGMEPLVGRLLVPYFGGAAHVWLTSLMFFQAMLLVGYLYAHLLARKLGPWHLLLLALPLLNLPLGVTATPVPETPLLTLLGILMVHFSLPFVILSTTAVVAQAWLARSRYGQTHEPYPLYAASNAGSLLALMGYAFLAEPLLGVRTQSFAWTFAYLVYIGLVVMAWFTVRPDQGPVVSVAEKSSTATSGDAPKLSRYALWLLLSSLPSMFLSTVTNYIALEVGSFPMVWVFPLALYLGSFVVTFRSKGGIPKFLTFTWLEVVIFGFLLYLLPIGWTGWFGAVVGPLLLLLAICLVANGALYESRPPMRYLTSFYLTLALGGFLGGAAISLVAPLVFPGLFEYPLTLAALAITFWWCRGKSSLALWHNSTRAVSIVRCVVIGIALGLLCACSILHFKGVETACKFRHRNFYGIIRVIDEPPTDAGLGGFRKLVHGTTDHGSQMLDLHQRGTPTSYYYIGGATADVYTLAPSPRRIAVLGLGAGVVSAYTRPNDSLTYYEIDPDNEKIARAWFTYLDDSKAPVRVVVGDGRLSMNETGQDQEKYDIIHIDAFTGDGIPTHLLTREAMEVYLRRLAPDGLILFHISNRYYDLRAVVKSTGELLNLPGVMNIPSPKAKLNKYQNPSQCLVLARNPERLQALVQRGWVKLGKGDGLAETAPWTDDYINILNPLLAKLRSR